jgi:DNA-binding NarL/FixJ family response regulator
VPLSYLFGGPGSNLSEQDRAILTLLRPHLLRPSSTAKGRRNSAPEFTPRQWDLLRLMAAGRTNTQIARELGLAEGTARTHPETSMAGSGFRTAGRRLSVRFLTR